jgi:hypothetical protein
MGHRQISRRLPTARLAAFATMALSVALLSLWASASAPAARLVARDGKIHACYKARGKGKGTLRVVRNAKVRCPRGWRKTAWRAGGAPGAAGENGAAGGTGEAGPAGGNGVNGANGSTGTTGKVESLESKVTELLGKVQSLEGILSGISNAQLKEAIGKVPAVASLCTEAKKLNEQSNGLGTALSGLSTVVGTLTALGLPAIPAALPGFECP